MIVDKKVVVEMKINNEETEIVRRRWRCGQLLLSMAGRYVAIYEYGTCISSCLKVGPNNI